MRIITNSVMDFIVKKTTELSEIERQGLLDCFNDVFERERSLEEMLNQYLNTPMGYCIHSLCIDEERIVAAHTAFPSYYWVGERKVKAYVTGDTMVRKDYRDGAVFLDIMTGLTSFMKNNNYTFVFGFPNDNSYAVNKKGKLGVEFGKLDVYIMLYRIGGVKKALFWLNPLSTLFSYLWLAVSRVGAKTEISKPYIHKDDETYNPTRYKRMDGNYNHVKLDDFEFYYKIKLQEGVRTAFLIDVVGKSERRFQKAVKYIVRVEKNKFDLLMYIGHLPTDVKRIGLIKIPHKFEPKHFYMTGKVCDKSLDKKLIYEIKNWDVNMSDYDLL